MTARAKSVPHALWWGLAAGAGLILFWPPKTAKAAVSSSATQKKFQDLIAAEARRQGVPVAFALAIGQLESNFSDAVGDNGKSFGPLQVHISALKPGETDAQHRDYRWNIPRGVEIMKDRLRRAEGLSELARIMYVCGPGYLTSCKIATRENIIAKWRPAAARWGVLVRY